MTATRLVFMSGSRPRWLMFLTMRYVGQMNMVPSENAASIWLKIFSCGPRKSARKKMMLNVTTQRYT